MRMVCVEMIESFLQTPGVLRHLLLGRLHAGEMGGSRGSVIPAANARIAWGLGGQSEGAGGNNAVHSPADARTPQGRKARERLATMATSIHLPTNARTPGVWGALRQQGVKNRYCAKRRSRIAIRAGTSGANIVQASEPAGPCAQGEVGP